MVWLKAVLKNPGEKAQEICVKDTLEEWQKLVGGYIETVDMGHGIIMLVNEEGKLRGMKQNFINDREVIVGPAVFIRTFGEDFASLNAGDIRWLLSVFKHDDEIVRVV